MFEPRGKDDPPSLPSLLRSFLNSLLHLSVPPCRSQPGRIDKIYRSKFVAPISAPTVAPVINETEVTPSPHPIGPKCVDTSTLPMCSDIGYTRAYFPNFRGQQDPNEAREELADFMPLVRGVCSNAIAHLLCSVYAPFCSDEDLETPVRPYPCVEMCRSVRSSCMEIVESFGMGWPAQLNCENPDIYKPRNSSNQLVYCPPENVTLPSNLLPFTTTTDASATSTPTNAATRMITPTATPTNDASRTATTANEIPHTPQVLTISPPDPGSSRCESTSRIPTCSNIGYQQAFFPSFRHQTVIGANNELSNMKPLLDSNCSGILLHLLCSVNAPLCYMDGNNKPQRLHPCVELCQHVRQSCEPVLLSHGLRWPAHLDCDNSEIYRANDSFSYCPSSLMPDETTTPEPVTEVTSPPTQRTSMPPDAAPKPPSESGK